jgi:hypothetical protein
LNDDDLAVVPISRFPSNVSDNRGVVFAFAALNEHQLTSHLHRAHIVIRFDLDGFVVDDG